MDDLLICSKNRINFNCIKGLLKEKYKMKDIGKVSAHLGINIEYNEMKMKFH